MMLADLASASSSERVAIMQMVKSGSCTVDEAIHCIKEMAGLEFRGFLEPHHVNGHETGWKHGADTFGAK